MSNTRALIAARKSTKARGSSGPVEGQSLHTQDEYSRRFCERLGWEIAGVAKDTISGRVAPIDRKNLGTWLAEPTRFDAVVAYRSDRLSRGDQEDWTRIEHWATEHRKTLVLVDGGHGIRYPARDDSDYWQWTAEKRRAGREWDEIRERSLRFQGALTRKGAFMGRPPWGYRIVGDYYSKRLEAVPAEAQIIREVFRRVTEGESLDSIAAWVTEASGRPTEQTFIGRMIKNWKYAGRMERNGQHYGDCPPIVSVEELTAAQRSMRSRATKTGGRPAIETPPFMIMTCGECGYRMYRGGGRNGFRYFCTGPSHSFSMPCILADRAVVALLRNSTLRQPEPVLIKGHDFRGDIATLKRDRTQALERDDIETVIRLTQEIKDLEGRGVEPDRVEYKLTGDTPTVGEKFSRLTVDEIRAELRKGWTVFATPSTGRLRIEAPWTARPDLH